MRKFILKFQVLNVQIEYFINILVQNNFQIFVILTKYVIKILTYIYKKKVLGTYVSLIFL